MYKCATVTRGELELLRTVRHVVRLGRVLRLDDDALVLQHGRIPTGPSSLHVDCTATGTPATSPRPVFEAGRIVVQPVRSCSPSLNAAVIGHLEATRADDDAKNRLTPVNPYPTVPLDWVRGLLVSMEAAHAWGADPELASWLEASRLNQLRGLAAVAHEPRTAAAFERFGTYVQPGLENARRLLTALPGQPSADAPRAEAPAPDGASLADA